MGLRCSLLGHTFDETEVRRDRRERGESEVVTVVTQVERCSRCGAERVVSENKEVVSVVDADEVGLDESGNAGDGAEPEGRAEPVSEGVDPDAEQGPEPDAQGSVAGDGETDSDPDPAPSTDEGADVASPSDPAEEDAEFITETEGSLGGGEDVTEDVPPEMEGGIGGMAARSGAFGDDESAGDDEIDETGESAEDAEILDAPETDRAPGQWPDEPDEGEPWEPDALGEEDETESTADPAPEVEPVAEPSFTVPDGSLRCPGCGFEVDADSSFRAGDACPECQRDYLEAPDGT